MKRSGILVLLGVVLAGVSPAFGQTGPALMLMPWRGERHIETSADAYIFNDGHTDNAGADDIDLKIYDVQGRINVDPHRDFLRFGFDMTYLDIHSNDPALPERLVDQSVAVGFGLGRSEAWEFGAIVGVGYAGNNPYGDSHALYGKADLIASYKIDEKQSLQFILDYNGNRSIFPDIPLPAIAYNHKVSDKLWYTVGIPFSAIYWVPVERVIVNVNYSLPFTFTGSASWEFIDSLHLFGLFANRFESFHIDGDNENRRLFFSQKRVEAGLRWEACENAELIVAGGYAFDQDFERGFDARDLDSVRDISDEPYVRVGLKLNF